MRYFNKQTKYKNNYLLKPNFANFATPVDCDSTSSSVIRRLWVLLDSAVDPVAMIDLYLRIANLVNSDAVTSECCCCNASLCSRNQDINVTSGARFYQTLRKCTFKLMYFANMPPCYLIVHFIFLFLNRL